MAKTGTSAIIRKILGSVSLRPAVREHSSRMIAYFVCSSGLLKCSACRMYAKAEIRHDTIVKAAAKITESLWNVRNPAR